MIELPVFEHVTRRTLLRRGALALAGGALLVACGNDDESALSASPSATAATSPTAPTGSTAGTPTTTATVPSDTEASAGASSSTDTPTDDAEAHPVTLAFTYSPSDSSGRVRNPYIAAWIEDDTSNMVGLVSVWYEARESKYLRELTEFSGAATSVASGTVDAVSGATRTPGDYLLQWDGTGLDGTSLNGAYTLWVEAAREHGPHSVTSGPITLGQAGAATVAGNGELSDVIVTVA